MPPREQVPFEHLLLEDLGSYACRPRAFVYWAFPWGEAGTELAKRSGPEAWQEEALTIMETALLAGLKRESEIIKEALQLCVRSGHDIGKSAFVCWIILWAVSTREDTKGVVTANTEKQLRLKLWAELAKWHRLFIARQFFKVTATSIQALDEERAKEWKIDAIPWSEDNPEAFQGLHNYGKRALVIFDEASGIADKVWEIVDGVMNEADTELIWIATGNPTRNIGRFRECFDTQGQGQFWHPLKVDSRSVSFTNKERIEKAIALWGEDSDYVKVRFLGEFPSSGNAQFIPNEYIDAAMVAVPVSYPHEPLIMAVDVARMGDDETVIGFRRGRDARTISWTRMRKMDNIGVGTTVAALIAKHSPDAVFIDEGGTGSGVVDFVRHLGHSVIGVQFGGMAGIPSEGDKAFNKRAEMYLNLRTWLRTGGAIPYDRELQKQLVSIEYGHSKSKASYGAIILAPKEDLDESPDLADMFALTFAFPVSSKHWGRGVDCAVDYDPLGPDALTFGGASKAPLFIPQYPAHLLNKDLH